LFGALGSRRKNSGLEREMKNGKTCFGILRIIKRFGDVALLLAFFAVLCGRAEAQATSSVTGLVSDPSGAVVLDAQVTLADPNSAFSATVKTNDSGVYQFSQGTFPIDFTQTAPAVFVGTQSDIGGHIHQVSQNGQTIVQYFSNETNALGAFAFPFGGGTGNRNVARGPGFWNLDMSALKDFKMPWSENHVLQFRTDAFNIFNHPNFEPPNASLQTPGNFGSINATIPGPDGNSYARQLQLGLKYIF
jgi:hypothetical protein